MARMLLVAMGSSGDVNPFVGIGIALKKRGHDVTVITNEHFQGAVEGVGLSFARAGTNAHYSEAIGHPDFWHPKKGPPLLFRLALSTMPETYDRVTELNVPGETVLAAPPQALGAPIAAEKLKIPCASVFPNPILLRSVHSPPKTSMLTIPKWIGPWGAGCLYKVLDWKLDRIMVKPVGAFRESVGLSPMGGVFGTWLRQSDRIIGLWPEWLYEPQPDWPEQAVVTGFVEYDGAATVDSASGAEASGFDDAAVTDRPIVFTCGTAMSQGRDFFAAAAEACRLLSRPGLLLTQHAEQLPASLPPNVKHVRYAPFAKLLPRASALVHHGGAGTLARGLKAGIPQVIMPLSYDQFDNVDRLVRLGVAAEIHRKGLTGRKLANTLARLLDSPTVRERCRHYADRLVDSAPLEETCGYLEQLLDTSSVAS